MRRTAGFAVCWVIAALSGCASLTNPVADGVPVRHLTPEFLGTPKALSRQVPLSLLRQKSVDVYKLAPGDILGVWIETILGEAKQSPPVRLSERGDLPPAIGYPIPVRADGTVALPLINPVSVKGLSVEEAQAAIIKAYTSPKEILKPGAERVIVTLMRRRQYHVLVFRESVPGGLGVAQQDTGSFSYGPAGITPGPSEQLVQTQRSTGYAVDLPAYENDVLNALAQTGGLPSLESANEIIIQRGFFKDGRDRNALLYEFQAAQADCQSLLASGGGSGRIIRIPLRLQPGEELTFKPEDIVLETGDIIFVPARKPEIFYTGGLLPPGEYLLPRDRDLNVLEAVSRVRGPLINGAFNLSNLNGAIIAPGIGGPSPSLLAVIRQTPGGGQVIIRVDLNKAFRDPRERILVQPGDFLVLQETPGEALARYSSQMFKFDLLYRYLTSSRATGTFTGVAP